LTVKEGEKVANFSRRSAEVLAGAGTGHVVAHVHDVVLVQGTAPLLKIVASVAIA